MSEPKNFIEINGRKYDVRSKTMNDVFAPASGSQPAQVIRPTQPIQATRPPHSSAHRSGIKQKPKVSHTHPVKHVSPKTPQKSKTLMRPAVKKPKHTVPAKAETTKKPIVHVIPTERLKRAGQVKKSPQIRRFQPLQNRPAAVTKRHEPLPVVEPIYNAIKKEENVIRESISESIDQFEQAIHSATSHLETYVEENTSRKFRKAAFAFASLSIVLLCSFVIYQAVPAVKVKVAGTKAGFSAELPNYSPAGYGLGSNISAKSGEVTLAYNSRTDSKGYKITQQPSDWNSQSLINNFLEAENKKYQTFDTNGKRIYIYDDTNATWVNGGIWYKVEGDARLTTDQLLRIASGL